MFDVSPISTSIKSTTKPTSQIAEKSGRRAVLSLSSDLLHDRTAEMASPVMCRKSAARYLGVASQTLAQWACSRKVLLPYSKIGRKVVYRQADLDAFIVINRQGAELFPGMEARHG